MFADTGLTWALCSCRCHKDIGEQVTLMYVFVKYKFKFKSLVSTKLLKANLMHRNITCCAGLWHWQLSDCCITVTAHSTAFTGLLLLQEFWQCCFLLSAGFKCPVCSKSVASNEMEVHFIMCLSKPRLSYNGKTRPHCPHSYSRKLQRYQFSIYPLHYFPPFLCNCISLSFHSPFHSWVCELWMTP